MVQLMKLNFQKKISFVHFIFLLLCFFLSQSIYDASWGVAAFLIMTALFTLNLPIKVLRNIMTPMAISCSFFIVDWERQYLENWIHLSLVYLVLIPARPKALRLLTLLVGIELCYLSHFYKVPPLAYGWIVIGVCALGYGNWFASLEGRRTGLRSKRSQHFSLFNRGSVLTLALAFVGVFLALGLNILKPAKAKITEKPEAPVATQRNNQPLGQMGESISNYDPWKSVSHAEVAFLTLGTPETNRLYYLRALTVPDPAFKNGQLIWRLNPNRHSPDLRGETLHEGHEKRMARLLIRNDFTSTLLRPDGASAILGVDRLRDQHFNLYPRQSNDRPENYQVDLGHTSYPAQEQLEGQGSDYLYIPGDFESRMIKKIKELKTWQTLPKHEAVKEIRKWLIERCLYSLEDMRVLKNFKGETLLAFMTGPRQSRRGSCQQFAAAQALLMRAVDIPSRCVLGFSSRESSNSAIVFRKRHGHAWCEYRVKGRWHRIDPTPTSSWDERADMSTLPGFNQPTHIELDASIEEGREFNIEYVIGLLLLLVIYVAVKLIKRFKKTVQDKNPLKKSSQEILALCQQLKIPVKPHSTISQLIEKIQLKTEIDLSQAHQNYLDIRYGYAEQSHQWPKVVISE
jgi:hypothetical protein